MSDTLSKYPLLNHKSCPTITDFQPPPFEDCFLLTSSGWKVGQVGKVRFSSYGFFRPVYVQGHSFPVDGVYDWQSITYPPLPPAPVDQVASLIS